MIASHRHRFIFLKTNKTASTSAEIALSAFCGPGDIITPITPRDEKIRTALGFTGPQHYRFDANEPRTARPDRFRDCKYFNHISGVMARQSLGQAVWDEYFKFCIERNPWDRVVSIYFWWRSDQKNQSFSDFLRSSRAVRNLKLRGLELYSENGHPLVDRVCFYESLQADLEDVCSDLGISGRVVLPHAKKSRFGPDRDYRRFYNATDREWVAEVFAEEIERYNYSF